MDGVTHVRSVMAYEMSDGVLNTYLLDVSCQFLFRGGELWVNDLRINNAFTEIVHGCTPETISNGFDGDGGNGFVSKAAVIVYTQYSDWRLDPETPKLVIGNNPTDYGELGARNSSFVQYAGTIQLLGDLVIGDGEGVLGSYAFFGQTMSVGAISLLVATEVWDISRNRLMRTSVRKR